MNGGVVLYLVLLAWESRLLLCACMTGLVRVVVACGTERDAFESCIIDCSNGIVKCTVVMLVLIVGVHHTEFCEDAII